MAEAEYSWRGVESPVLRGAALRFFAWFANTPLFPLVNRLLAKSSGIPQVCQRSLLKTREASSRGSSHGVACTSLALTFEC